VPRPRARGRSVRPPSGFSLSRTVLAPQAPYGSYTTWRSLTDTAKSHCLLLSLRRRGVGWTRTVPSDENPDIRIYRPAASAGDLLCRVPSREQEPSGSFTPDIALSVVVSEEDCFGEGPEVFGLATEIRGRVWKLLVELDWIAGPVQPTQEA
jgi:hypothetical protein